MILEEGRIQGYGSHLELLESNKYYQQINQSQMGGGTYESNEEEDQSA